MNKKQIQAARVINNIVVNIEVITEDFLSDTQLFIINSKTGIPKIGDKYYPETNTFFNQNDYDNENLKNISEEQKEFEKSFFKFLKSRNVR